jgi:hypothetical protein
VVDDLAEDRRHARKHMFVGIAVRAVVAIRITTMAAISP